MDVSKFSSHVADLFKSGALDGLTSAEINEIISKATVADNLQKVVWSPNTHFTNQDQIDSYRKYVEGDMPYFMYSTHVSFGSYFKLIPTDATHKERWYDTSGSKSINETSMAIIKDGWLYEIKSNTFFLEKPDLVVAGTENVPDCLEKLLTQRTALCKWDYAARMPICTFASQVDSDIALQKLTRQVADNQQADNQLVLQQTDFIRQQSLELQELKQQVMAQQIQLNTLILPPSAPVAETDAELVAETDADDAHTPIANVVVAEMCEHRSKRPSNEQIVEACVWVTIAGMGYVAFQYM